MCCSNCNKDLPIVNKHFNLCLFCNRDRLDSSKNKKRGNVPKNKPNALRRKKKPTENYGFVKNLVSKKNKSDKIKEDELFYEECFNNSNHRCEECGTQLPTEFRDVDGKVIARWRYSHIIPKSIAPDLRHELININHLCLKHHMEWENGEKENMNIYEKNKKRLPNYF